MIEQGKFTQNAPPSQVAGVMPNDSNIEFIGIRDTKEVLWLQNGNNHYFSDLPNIYFEILKEAYLKDKKAVSFLSEVAESINRQVELYTYYMYGDLDSTADIENDQLSASENFRDSIQCPSLHWNSKSITIGDHELTPRQLIIIDLINENLPDKAISSCLGISIKTLDNHKSKLYKSLNITTKVELMKLAVLNKIIS